MIRSRTTATPTCPTVREAERHSGGRGVPQGRDQRVPGLRRTPQDLWRNVSLGQSISNVSLRITRSVLLNSLRRSILAFG